GLVAGAVEPGIAQRVGHGLAGLVADEVLLVLCGGEAADRAAAAARKRLDRVEDVLAGAVDVVRVIGAVGESDAARGAAGARAAVGGEGAGRQEDFVDRAVVGGVGLEVLLYFTLHERIAHVLRRR